MSNPPWPIEEIPDGDSLYMRAHKSYYKDGELQPGVFRERNGSISVDWNKYATPVQTQSRAQNHPLRNSVIALMAGQVRLIERMSVVHDPINDPLVPGYPWRAHSGLRGLPNDELRTEVRVLLWAAVFATPIVFSE